MGVSGVMIFQFVDVKNACLIVFQFSGAVGLTRWMKGGGVSLDAAVL